MPFVSQLVEKKHNLFILVLVFLCGWATWPSSCLLIDEWMKWNLNQGFACLALLIFFIWRQPFTESETITEESKLLNALLACASLAWCLAQLGNLYLPATFLTLCCISLLLANIYGWSVLVRIFPFLGLLIFALPIWSGDLLVYISSLVITYILKIGNLTLHIQDNLIATPWGTIVIAEGCSGLRYLIVTLLLAYLLCLLNQYSIKTGAMVFILAIILALLTNWVRITIIVLVGYFTEMKHSLVYEHGTFGWILFASFLLPALYLTPQNPAQISTVAVKINFTKFMLVSWLLGPAIYLLIPFNDLSKNPITLTKLKLDFPQAESSFPPLRLYSPPGSNLESTDVKIGNTTIHIEVATFSTQNKNEKLVPYIKEVFDSEIWRRIDTSPTSKSNKPVQILEHRVFKQRVALAFRFQVGEWFSQSYYSAKLLQIPAKLGGQHYFGLWSAQAQCTGNCETEANALSSLSEKW